MNWATQIAARVAKTAASLLCRLVPPVVQPPHAKPTIIVMTAPQIKPQTPNLTFPPVSGFIDVPSGARRFFYRSSSSSAFFRIRSSDVLKHLPPALARPTALIRAGLLKPSADHPIRAVRNRGKRVHLPMCLPLESPASLVRPRGASGHAFSVGWRGGSMAPAEVNAWIWTYAASCRLRFSAQTSAH